MDTKKPNTLSSAPLLGLGTKAKPGPVRASLNK